MKKLIILAAAIISVTSIGYAANALLKVEDHSKCEHGMRCPTCNGSGFQGNANCFICKGTGRNSSY
ncbi:hypothetical protein HQ447_05165 [bacterium]|nr:hypothetical protein [bacterium]